MRLLIVGYGKMGRLVDQLAAEQGIDVVGRVDEGREEWVPADVAIDFTTADALVGNFPKYVERRLPVVIGTTGWSAHASEMRAAAERRPPEGATSGDEVVREGAHGRAGRHGARDRRRRFQQAHRRTHRSLQPLRLERDHHKPDGKQHRDHLSEQEPQPLHGCP